MIAKNPNKVCILARQTRYARCICVVQHILWDIRQMTLLCNVVLYYQIGKGKKHIERVLWMFPPTHPCIAKRKKLKDLASEKRKFKLCKSFEKSDIYIYIYIHTHTRFPQLLSRLHAINHIQNEIDTNEFTKCSQDYCLPT
jgi:hypothetical protein